MVIIQTTEYMWGRYAEKPAGGPEYIFQNRRLLLYSGDHRNFDCCVDPSSALILRRRRSRRLEGWGRPVPLMLRDAALRAAPQHEGERAMLKHEGERESNAQPVMITGSRSLCRDAGQDGGPNESHTRMTKSAAVTAQTATTTAKTISLKITIAYGSRAGSQGRQNKRQKKHACAVRCRTLPAFRPAAIPRRRRSRPSGLLALLPPMPGAAKRWKCRNSSAGRAHHS
jgi:hypothetical protein